MSHLKLSGGSRKYRCLCPYYFKWIIQKLRNSLKGQVNTQYRNEEKWIKHLRIDVDKSPMEIIAEKSNRKAPHKQKGKRNNTKK